MTVGEVRAASNFALLRRIALALVRQGNTVKTGLKNRRILACTIHVYLANALAGGLLSIVEGATAPAGGTESPARQVFTRCGLAGQHRQ